MMDYNVNINKICRVCLEEGVLTTIFNTEFAMIPSDMMMLCAKVRVCKNDGLPAVICNNCIYRLGVAYHFKQQCENSDMRLRQYLGLMDKGFYCRDNETMTDETWPSMGNILKGAGTSSNAGSTVAVDGDDDDEDDDNNHHLNRNIVLKRMPQRKTRSKNRYIRKAPEERKKRGPKPTPKVPQTCYECNKSFKCAAQLQMHMRIHTGERPYQCTYCPRRFAQKHNLSIHVRTHTGERPFQCEICSKQFSAMGNFQAHKKIHTGVRDQVCHVCNKTFITAGDLSRHMITHSGLKNHHCDTCGKSFSRHRDMLAHKRKIHLNQRGGGVTDVRCPECHKVFATSAGLSTHFRIHGAPPHLTHGHPSIVVQPTAQPSLPMHPTTIIAAPTAIGGSLGGAPLGVPMSLQPPPPPPTGLSMLAHAQPTLSMIHSQRLHPF